jgi:hypothetical protein
MTSGSKALGWSPGYTMMCERFIRIGKLRVSISIGRGGRLALDLRIQGARREVRDRRRSAREGDGAAGRDDG